MTPHPRLRSFISYRRSTRDDASTGARPEAKTIRILLVNNYAHVTGGADRHCLDLAAHLRAAGHEVAFLATSDPRNVESQGVFVTASVTHATRDAISAPRAVQVAGRAVWNRDAAAAMDRLVDRFLPDVVHTHKLLPQLSLAPVVVAARRRVPITQTLHDYELLAASAMDAGGRRIDRDESRLRYRALNTMTHPLRRSVYVPRVDAWVAVSDYVARAYADVGIASTVLPNFANPPEGGELPRFEDRDGALYVGRLSTEKGISDLLAVAAALPSICFRVVGDGPLAGSVRTCAARLANLVYVGPTDHSGVAREMRRARVVTMPSRWEEPGPLAALEAMAFGAAVVAYPRGGLAEYVANAGAGEVCAESPNALAEAVVRFHENREIWGRASSAGQAAVRTVHSPLRYVERIEEVYAAAARSRAGPV